MARSSRCRRDWSSSNTELCRQNGGVIVLRVLAFLAGGALVAWTLLSAVRGVVLPRGESVLLSRLVFVPLRDLFRIRLRFTSTWEQRDRIMALYGPIALLTLPFAWLVLVL